MPRENSNHVRMIFPALALITAISLAGCDASSSSEGDASQLGYIPDTSSVESSLTFAKQHDLEWEIGILEDGVVTATEYEDSYDRYMQCLSDLGYVPGIPKYLDPISSLQWKSLMPFEGLKDSEEMAEKSHRQCGIPLYLIEDPYMSSSTHRMETRLLSAFKECLDRNDITYVGTETNYNEFTEDLSDQEFMNGPHFTCLVESMKETHPEAIGGGVSR